MSILITVSILAIVVLYLGLFKGGAKLLLPVTLLGLLTALFLCFDQWKDNHSQAFGPFNIPVFSGMMHFDNFGMAFSGLAILSTMLILLLSKGYFEKISTHRAECYTLILFALAGILVMVSYHNLVMLFIGIEIMSVSLYILAGINKNDFASNEAALKYFLMGAFSTGFLLFGITLMYGATGTFDIDLISSYVIIPFANKSAHAVISPLFYAGVILITIGLCFKVGVAPFHFWTPDVYQGAPTLVTAFMSTVVKTAGFAAFLKFFAYCLYPLIDFWAPILLTISIITLVIGNVTAFYQQSFKRMLAYSSISHAGYMLFAIIALGPNSIPGIFLYTLAYSIASIVAFGALILIQNQNGSDSFDSFNGLSKRNPFLALTLTIAMLSLAGIPLTAGFIGKFMMFSAALNHFHFWLVLIAVVNAVIGIAYYLRVIIAMYFNDAEQSEIEVPAYFKIVMALSAAATILIGVYPSVLPNLFV